MKPLVVILASVIVACAVQAKADVTPAGLVPLPCAVGALQPVSTVYCKRKRNYVTPVAREVLTSVAEALTRAHPGAVVRYMEASWPSGVRPMPPHFSHGDGRQIDLALFYKDRNGRQLSIPPRAVGPPIAPGYGAYEPPHDSSRRACANVPGPHDRPDPPAGRNWLLDEPRTAELIRRLISAPEVRRVFLEPHLKTRLGFERSDKVRFAGCAAARHDDHIHVDFH